MSKTNLVVFDFDDTLVHSDGHTEDFSILSEIKKGGFHLAIASRNDTYHVEEQLSKLGIHHLFGYVMADFRPKVFQIREIIFESQKVGIEFQHIVFIDDYLPHIERIMRDEPGVITLHFGEAVKTLDDVKEKLFSL
ncbi:MAG: hypothetical protein ACTSWA_05680 [Candidatus Thorarchaeota archaeon]